MRHRITNIGNGQVGTDQTVKELARLVNNSLHRPYIRILALRILERANTSSRDPVRAAWAIFTWVRHEIAYVKDPINVETVQEPEVTAKLKAGDCDDHAALVMALGLAIGMPGRFVVVGMSPDNFQHIYTELNCNGQWIPLDTASNLDFGRAGILSAKKIYSYTGDTVMSLGTLVFQPLPGAASSGAGVKPPSPFIQPTGNVPTVNQVKAAAYKAAYLQLKKNWNEGLINLNDLKSYLTVIDQGNSPSRGTIVESVMRQAISDFIRLVVSKNMQSFKPYGQVNGMEGLDGFLKSVWGAVKGAVGAVTKLVTGGGGTIQVKLPSVTPATASVIPASPGVMQEISGFLTSPVALVGLGIIAVLLLRK